MDNNFSVENIIIKLDNGNELKLDVTTRISSIKNILNKSVNNTTVKRIDKIDIKQVEQDIKNDARWNINDFYLDSLDTMNYFIYYSYNYLINNFIGIKCIKNSKCYYCMTITIPTKNYELLKNIILFEINNFDGRHNMNISDFLPFIKTMYKKEVIDLTYISTMGYECHWPGYPYCCYNIIGTHLSIEEHDKYTCIVCRL